MQHAMTFCLVSCYHSLLCGAVEHVRLRCLCKHGPTHRVPLRMPAGAEGQPAPNVVWQCCFPVMVVVMVMVVMRGRSSLREVGQAICVEGQATWLPAKPVRYCLGSMPLSMVEEHCNSVLCC